MTWVVPLALGGLAVLVMAVFTMLSARKRHHQMVQPPVQTSGPRILVHDINDDRCTGCDACVAVCPTNVLDLVANKSRVLRFQDCIQCEACMFACPTEALVMFPEGGMPPPLKIPEIDEHFQTAIPGQYLIGEVAGKPLVKNAANLGRVVVEHMLATGMYPGALGRGEALVDVAIIGSGPGGLSAALTCIQKGLSYVVLEKEQMIASTISRYPKGKLVMAEPYDTLNLSLLPVYDSSKEQLIAVWRELLDRIGLRVRQGESVESVQRAADGAFDVRTTVGAYRAQRVVLSIGTRGKPRTLQVPGENLPKVRSLLEDPDEFAGRAVLVVGGGDSACEAALALADAGAQVIISYRGKAFSRAAPKNKQAIEQYAAEGRIKAKLGSQVLGFEPDSVTLALGDGSQKRYPNHATFVLIGADPPVQWLEKMGVRFVERPHQHQMGKSDDLVRRFVANVFACPEDAARAAAQVLGGAVGLPPLLQPAGFPPPQAASAGEPMSGPRKWLRSATSIFSTKHTPVPVPPRAAQPTPATNQPLAMGMPGMPPAPGKGKRLEQPMPLSEFAKRGRTEGGKFINAGTHSGHGRRDQLSAGERTRILRMLRDEGGRLADEDSQVHIGAAPAPSRGFDFDFDDEGPANPPPPAPVARPDVPAKPAVVVGLAQAQASKSRSKRSTAGQQPGGRRPVPAPFGEEPTRQVDDRILKELRNHPPASPPPPPTPLAPPPAPRALVAPRPGPSGRTVPPPFGQEPTKLAQFDPGELDNATEFDPRPEKFLEIAPKTEPGGFDGDLVDDLDNQATAFAPATAEAFANLDQPRGRRAPPPQPSEDRTRAVNIRNDKSISDIDWDID